jgi:non-specific serine/threonine protein kinase
MGARFSESFRDLLRRYRQAAGLTQEGLAERASLSARAISDLERGARNRPWRETVQLLANALDLNREARSQLENAARSNNQTPREVAALDWRDAAEAVPDNLPVWLTSFVGRERESAEVTRLLTTTRLLTLTGAGGCGKTRLALHVAADHYDAFAAGVRFVDLAPVADPALVPHAVATAVGVFEAPNRPLLTSLSNYLRGREILLVLDNCEHLLDACAPLIDTLLRAAPRLRVLATSRERLGVSGETTWRVPSLSLPEAGAVAEGPGAVLPDSVQLFVERARAVKPDFALTPPNAEAITQICRRLDGIPLAIELAAARIRVLSVAEIASRLDDRFRFLVSSDRQTLPRQQTLRAVIDWSFDHLTLTERALFRRLGIFGGDFTLEAVEQVCGNHGDDVLTQLAGLLDKSLIESDGGAEVTRYHLQETIRYYALDQLASAAETERYAERHADWYLSCVRQRNAVFRAYDDRRWEEMALDLQADYSNVRAALGWCAGAPARFERGLQLVAGLWQVWERLGNLREAADWLDRFLPVTGELRSPARAAALQNAAWLACYSGDYQQGYALAVQALVISRESDDPFSLRLSLRMSGICAREAGDWKEARRLFAEGLQLARELGDTGGINGVAGFFDLQGTVDLAVGDYVTARVRLQESRALWVNNVLCVAWSDHNLGCLDLDEGHYDDAGHRLASSLRAFRQIRVSQGRFRCLGAFLALASATGDYARAACIDGALANYFDVTGMHGFATDAPRIERGAALARQALGSAEYQRIRASGATWPIERAIAYALGEYAGNS